MACIGETGQVDETDGEVCVEWKIPDFFSLLGEVDSYYQSPVFCLPDSSWRLRIYPKGTKDNPGWVCLCVTRQNSGPPVRLEVRSGIRKSNGTRGFLGDHLQKNANHIRPCFLSISELHSQRSTMAPLGVLTVYCKLQRKVPHPTEVSLSTRLWNLSGDLKKMLDEGKGTDFALKLKEGRELRAHRKILYARCGYFAGMLGNDFQENESGVADIDDIEEGVFRYILSYLYTGEVEGMADRNVCKIYVAADKLLLEELKKLCVYYMEQNLSLDLVCDVVAIVEKYDEGKLKETTLDYFTQHAKEVFDSDGWKKFSEENSRLAAKFLEKFSIWKRP